jgi:hypothetical protein
MTSRIFAAGIVVLGVGAMAAPVESTAGSGGLIAASSPAAGGAVRPSVAAPHFSHTFLPRAMTGGIPANIRNFRTLRLGDRRGLGFPLRRGYASYVPDYYPSDYEAAYGDFPYAHPPTENFSERARPIVIYQPGCRTDTQTVPSETGGERTINITRCY